MKVKDKMSSNAHHVSGENATQGEVWYKIYKSQGQIYDGIKLENFQLMPSNVLGYQIVFNAYHNRVDKMDRYWKTNT